MKVYIQEWTESERGWGTRFDGYAIHASVDDAVSHVHKHWGSMPDNVPDCYSRPSGSIYEVDAPDGMEEELLAAKLKGYPLYEHHANTQWIIEGIKNGKKVNTV